MSETDHPLVGAVFNRRYKISRFLGGGGFANVFLAEDQTMPRTLAVKVLRRAAFSEEMYRGVLARFKNEAMTMATFMHPNIVPIIDYGEYRNMPFLVMVYLPGGTLQSLLDSGPMPADKAARLLMPIAKALAYTHRKGVLHRDIKPANILMSESGDPMLTDFGIAKLVAPDGSSIPGATGTSIIGTPAYMAPEQGKGGKIDGRTDVYALGVVYYQCVTGRLPFEGGEAMEIIFKHIQEPFPPPRQFVPALPDIAVSAITTAMAKEPDKRYRDMQAFADVLYDISIAVPHPTPPPIPIPPPPKPPEEDIVMRWKKAEKISPRVLTSQPDWIWSLAFSPDNALLASGAYDGSIRLWGVTEGDVKRTLEGHDAQVRSVAFSPDGSLLASGASDNSVRLWKVADGEQLRKLDGHTGRVWSVSFSPDGASLISGSSDNTVRVWRVKDGKLLRTLEGHQDWVHQVAFDANGSRLASTSDDKTVILWKASDGAQVRKLEDPTEFSSHAAISADGKIWACGGATSIRLWSLDEGVKIRELKGHDLLLTSLAFSKDGKFLAGSGSSGSVYIWHLEDEQPLCKLEGSGTAIGSLVFSSDSTCLAAGYGNGQIRIWQVGA